MGRREGAALGNTHRLRRQANIISLIYLLAFPRAGLNRQSAREKGLSAWDIFHGNVRVEYHDPR